MSDKDPKPNEDTADTEDGESKTPQEPSEPPAPPAGAETTIDAAVQMEVVMLAVSAVRDIAESIAKRVKSCLGEEGGLVLIGDESLLSKLAEWRALEARIGVLEEEMGRLRSTTDKTEGAFTQPVEDITEFVAAVSKLLSYFQVETRYAGREVALDASTLYPALVGQLVRADVGRVVIGGAPGCRPSAGKDLISRMKRLLEFKSKFASLIAPPPADRNEAAPAGGGQGARPLVAAVDSLLSDLSGDKVAALQAASETLQAIEEASRALLLSAKIIKTGGYYRTTKSVLAAFFGGQLSYSAGTTISFVLTDLKSIQAVDGDALYHATSNVRVRNRAQTFSNLG